MWTFNHPDVFANYTKLSNADVAQAYLLGVTGLMHSANSFVIGPKTQEVMNERHRLERLEKKSYSDPGVSDDMKALNKKFGILHGVSSLLALLGVLTLGFHGVWIANAGVQGY
ncbi:hypothetical protein FRC02_001358 [Tulasnella sp. 418]|nr:hypothetical protein FRC02_001358 [Tulasnella sp. 418]